MGFWKKLFGLETENTYESNAYWEGVAKRKKENEEAVRKMRQQDYERQLLADQNLIAVNNSLAASTASSNTEVKHFVAPTHISLLIIILQ